MSGSASASADTDVVYSTDTQGIQDSDFKWLDITSLGTRMYSAPGHATSMLVVDVTDGLSWRALALTVTF